ncbi:hypothetical protein FMM75_14030 [Lachnospiraceae bacterium MD335]|nr:hypothetical protein [Lachnospiraceae bacterium MD335]
MIERIKKSFVRSHAAFIYEDICREMLFQKIGYRFIFGGCRRIL